MAHSLNTGRRALAGYSPSVLGGFALHADHRGVWTVQDLERMRRDSRIRLGLAIIKAPLQTVTWTVKGENQEVVDWVDRTLRTVWKNHLSQLLLLVDYGRTGGEPVWKHDEATGLVELKCLDFVHPYDLVPLERGGEWCGVRVKGLSGKGWLLMPNAFYVLNDPEFNVHYGRSRLLGAWEPFQEKSARHGAKDIRRLWYVKNAYRGGVMRHPMGILDLGDGSVRTCQDYAREIVEKAETGGVMALPNTRDDSGAYQWEYEDPKSNGDIGGVREYVHDLDDEIFEGMEIPREVVEAAQGGGSWAGRTVPFLIYLAGEDRIVSNLIGTLEKQLLRPGVDANFGEDAKFEIEVKSLIPPDEEAQAKEQAGGLGGAMGGAPEEEGPPADPIAELLGGEQMSAVRLAEDAWKPYLGKRGAAKGKQVGWQHSGTGRIVYGDKKPGGGEGGKAKPSPDDVSKAAALLKENPTAEGIKALVSTLLDMKADEIKAIQKQLGAKGGKTKSQLAQKIADHLAGSGEAKPEKAEKPAEPAAPKEPAEAPKVPTVMSEGGDVAPQPWSGMKAVQKKAVLEKAIQASGQPLAKFLMIGGLAELAEELEKSYPGVSMEQLGYGVKAYHAAMSGHLSDPKTPQIATPAEAPLLSAGGAGVLTVGPEKHARNPKLPDESWPKELTNGEKVAVQAYTDGGFKEINSSLRADGKPPEEFAEVHKEMQAAFAKVKPFKEPVPVIRGMKLEPEALKGFLAGLVHSHKTGEPLVMNGYVSTSTEVAAAFTSNVELKIAATHGIDASPVTHYSHEKELILNHGSQFRVKAARKVGDKYTIELEQIPPGKGA